MAQGAHARGSPAGPSAPPVGGRLLSRRAGATLYATLEAEVERLISQRALRPGDALPTEAELQARFGVSRATVRQALSRLEQRGIVERQQGRGTFVALPPIERALPELTGFTEHVRSRSMRASSVLVEYSVVLADAMSEARYYPSATPLARVVRVRYANDVAVGVHTVYLPLGLAERIGFTEAALRSDSAISLYALLTGAGFELRRAEEHLRARGADATEAELLGVRRGTPVMSVLRQSRDADDRLIEVVRAVYLGDKYDYVVQLDRSSGGARTGTGGVVTAGNPDRK